MKTEPELLYDIYKKLCDIDRHFVMLISKLNHDKNENWDEPLIL